MFVICDAFAGPDLVIKNILSYDKFDKLTVIQVDKAVKNLIS